MASPSTAPAASAAAAAAPRLPYVIYEGDTVICQTSDGRMFFQATGEGFVPDGDNRHYADTNSAQTLRQSDIGELRESGASGQEIIQKLVENSATWDTKTEFSKQKYLKKKQQKYMPRVRFLRCTAESLCRTYRLKNPAKICNLREDSLGQILVYANIFAGGQVLVVDTCMGLVTGAIAERQGGSGRILCPYDGQQPAADILRRFNFGTTQCSSDSFLGILRLIHRRGGLRLQTNARWTVVLTRLLCSQPEETVVEPPKVARDGLTPEEREQMATERAKGFTPEQQRRYDEKKARRLEKKIQRQPAATIRQWVRETSDSLVIAANYDPEQVLLALLPYLGRSKPFVIYSEFLEVVDRPFRLLLGARELTVSCCSLLQPLTRTFATLQKMEEVIDLQLNETWTRENQVLPGRTHPEMNMSACSGYLLSGIKILDVAPLGASAAAVSTLETEADEEEEAPAKKRKTESS
ncbi:hypothetical protein BBJ28_00020397 [Nothophytophthora sp. Chile5]|nr:hypothetical protein BBJ28_00020397 [Nothophytophthora sp. Chile5]